ncbi:MAG: hypothetical protein A2941_00060 [Candidatus Yanofskybacteria bacterium RIFCSPLOWO2_01_FULL_49_17]|uniref:Uncharacterized protein n=1 Tax=Candidatus Yanofskybacteria bacterium RIFCSPLOWO2_01_FULL_49_17 TaxID=1802700 RepID=A0A1F8GS54_9BACT|nr:MAG: hypothetical protein A2941_00060 [Candidatus Yanofskybacteria bacterium RIFCSPLOWO2_01_FULL_49_17]
MNKILWIVVIVLVAIGGYYLLRSNGSLGGPSTVENGSSPSPSASVKSGSSSKPKTATPTPSAGATATSKTYTQLVAEYVNRTIQFNSSCQATPATFVLKNNTSVLLDNRANVARTITVDGKAYALGAYGYQVVTLYSPTLPHTVGINCGSSVNVSSILLEANISGQ